MTDENELIEEKPIKIKKAEAATFVPTYNGLTLDVWSPDDVDKLDYDDQKKFKEVVKDIRFFYERDPIASTVINKMVEIGVTDLVFDQGSLSDNEFRIFTGIEDDLMEFMEDCALEYLLSGLVIPEVAYNAVDKKQLIEMGIKKYNTLTLPTSMWLRDPTTIKINSSMMSKEPSYFVLVPDDIVFFLTHEGKYSDGTSDPALYQQLLANFPAFVAKVVAGQKEILLENDLIVRRKYTTKTPYPVPYLYPALEPLRHKRNIRRMDYSIASRVISAIQLFQLGNDNFPVTEDDKDAFEDLKSQMTWRYTAGRDIERIFQLFANHTLKISWVAPDVSALLNENKYAEVNQDIFMALGFPKILITGETIRTQTSDPEFATLSPVKTMESMQRKLLKIARGIVAEVSEANALKSIPEVRFERINLQTMTNFINSMKVLYDTGNISRDSFDEAFGYNYEEESKKRTEETKELEQQGVAPYNQQPFSANPQTQQTQNTNKQQNQKQDNTENQKTNT